MKRLAATCASLVLAVAPAAATGSIDCADADGEASVSLTVGSLPVLSVVGAAIEADGMRWSLGGEGESAIAVGQAFQDADAMRVDFTDPNVESVVAALRLFSAHEGRHSAMAGTLHIAVRGAWALTCIGP